MEIRWHYPTRSGMLCLRVSGKKDVRTLVSPDDGLFFARMSVRLRPLGSPPELLPSPVPIDLWALLRVAQVSLIRSSSPAPRLFFLTLVQVFLMSSIHWFISAFMSFFSYPSLCFFWTTKLMSFSSPRCLFFFFLFLFSLGVRVVPMSVRDSLDSLGLGTSHGLTCSATCGPPSFSVSVTKFLFVGRQHP